MEIADKTLLWYLLTVTQQTAILLAFGRKRLAAQCMQTHYYVVMVGYKHVLVYDSHSHLSSQMVEWLVGEACKDASQWSGTAVCIFVIFKSLILPHCSVKPSSHMVVKLHKIHLLVCRHDRHVEQLNINITAHTLAKGISCSRPTMYHHVVAVIVLAADSSDVFFICVCV